MVLKGSHSLAWHFGKKAWGLSIMQTVLPTYCVGRLDCVYRGQCWWIVVCAFACLRGESKSLVNNT